MSKVVRLITAVGICELVGIAATPFTVSAIPTWYAGLLKPAISPPNFIFGPVWTVLYLLMGVAVFLVWENGSQKPKVKQALQIFAVQLGLNFLWSVLFFGLRSPLMGLVDIILMIAAIIVTIVVFHRISKPASYLLIPYLVWVGFATYLNYSIWLIN